MDIFWNCTITKSVLKLSTEEYSASSFIGPWFIITGLEKVPSANPGHVGDYIARQGTFYSHLSNGKGPKQVKLGLAQGNKI